jgi:hypothetical protein
MFEAIRDHDPRSARRAVEDHMGVSLRLYGQDLDEPIEELARETARRVVGSERDLEDGLLADL